MITARDQPNAPQFSVVVTKWNLRPVFTPQTFAFSAPSGARQVEFLPLPKREASRKSMESERNPLKAAVDISLPLLLLADVSPEAPLGLTGRAPPPFRSACWRR